MPIFMGMTYCLSFPASPCLPASTSVGNNNCRPQCRLSPLRGRSEGGVGNPGFFHRKDAKEFYYFLSFQRKLESMGLFSLDTRLHGYDIPLVIPDPIGNPYLFWMPVSTGMTGSSSFPRKRESRSVLDASFHWHDNQDSRKTDKLKTSFYPSALRTLAVSSAIRNGF